MIPILYVRPGIILTAFNATSLLAYFVYKKYAVWKLGLNTPEKFEAYVKEKTELSKRVMELTAELSQKTKVEVNLFYEEATKLESIEAIEKHFKESQILAKEVLAEMEWVKQNLKGTEKYFSLRKLKKIRTNEQLQEFSTKVRQNRTFEQLNVYHGMPLYMRGKCLPMLQQLFSL